MAEKFDSKLLENCRRTDGHNIVSLPINPVVQIGPTPTFVNQFVVLCSKCGTVLEDIQKTRRPGRSGNGKKGSPAFQVEEGAEKEKS